MNPSGYRIEEKKETDGYHHHHPGASPQGIALEEKSTHSYKSTHSTRSSVLERAREYNRRIDQQNNNRRAKSLERSSNAGASDYSDRSRSVGRSPQNNTFLASGNTVSTHERAMASVRKDTAKQQPLQQQQQQPQGTPTTPALARRLKSNQLLQQQAAAAAAAAEPLTPVSARNPSSSSAAPSRTPTASRHATPQQQPVVGATTTPRKTPSAQQQRVTSNNTHSKSPQRSSRSQPKQQQPPPAQQQPPPGDGDPEGQQEQNNHNAVVTPELLVDALSGHEDGLLAIAEKLMEHYDSGYDVMGEAIIDAFADVQKLFQHVVEAAHMEGAAFEASRREAEMAELRKQNEAAGLPLDTTEEGPATPSAATPAGRHDEFVDQDVKDVLTEAIRKGTTMRDANQHEDCYRMYEQACQSASALLPVDSDHRGRLQLSIARAESMGPDRACAILRYAMDDVLRSGMRAGRTPLPDPSKRADVVLSRPTPSAAGSTTSHGASTSTGSNFYKVAQSPDEALASLMEEMKEIMNAPVYNDTPLQSVAIRFWSALTDSQKSQQKNEERLEQALGKLKGDFLLARAEWEEKLNKSNEKADMYKEKYDKLKDDKLKDSKHSGRHASGGAGSSSTSSGGYHGDDLMEQARHNYRSADDGRRRFPSSRNGGSSSAASRTGSVASLGSGIAVHAKKLVNTIHDFNCNGDHMANDQIRDEMQDMAKKSHAQRSVGQQVANKSPHRNKQQQQGTPHSATRGTSSTRNQGGGASSRSFREYSKSPKRMDV